MVQNKFSHWILSFLFKEAARTDLSLPVLRELATRGYQLVKWQSGNSTHAPCRELNDQQWPLEDFISNLRHDAPIAEKSHPNDLNCFLIVSGEGLPSVSVNYDGVVTEL